MWSLYECVVVRLNQCVKLSKTLLLPNAGKHTSRVMKRKRAVLNPPTNITSRLAQPRKVYMLAVVVRSGASQCLKHGLKPYFAECLSVALHTDCEALLVFINTIFLVEQGFLSEGEPQGSEEKGAKQVRSIP